GRVPRSLDGAEFPEGECQGRLNKDIHARSERAADVVRVRVVTRAYHQRLHVRRAEQPPDVRGGFTEAELLAVVRGAQSAPAGDRLQLGAACCKGRDEDAAAIVVRADDGNPDGRRLGRRWHFNCPPQRRPCGDRTRVVGGTPAIV